MTKEQVYKHYHVIKRYIEAPYKGVLVKYNNKWELMYDPEFYEDNIYVTNDEWADISKQFIDDRTKIEYHGFNNWTTTAATGVETMRLNDIDNYRIKPDEQKFKVEDWIVSAGTKYLLKDNMDVSHFISIDAKLWIPTPEELVVFWNKNQSTPTYVIRMFNSIEVSNDGTIYYIDNVNEYWDNVAPLEFINELKEGK